MAEKTFQHTGLVLHIFGEKRGRGRRRWVSNFPNTFNNNTEVGVTVITIMTVLVGRLGGSQ